jgi:hypothetical protein
MRGNAALLKRRVRSIVQGMVRAPLKKAGMIVLLAFLAFTAFYAEPFVFTRRAHEHDRHGPPSALYWAARGEYPRREKH